MAALLHLAVFCSLADRVALYNFLLVNKSPATLNQGEKCVLKKSHFFFTSQLFFMKRTRFLMFCILVERVELYIFCLYGMALE